jgi:hypothetical protein
VSTINNVNPKLQDILDQWQADGRHQARAGRADSVLSHFEQHHVSQLDNPVQVRLNFDKDENIDASKRRALLKAASMCQKPDNPAEINKAYQKFCWKRQQQGPKPPQLAPGLLVRHIMKRIPCLWHALARFLGPGTLVGNVMKRTDFETHFYTSTSNPFSGHTSRNWPPTSTVDILLDPKTGLALQRRMLRSPDPQLQVKLMPLSRHQMWSFYDPASPAAPFGNLGKGAKEIRRRLGLGHVPIGERLLLFSFRLPPEVSAHVPTAFDAELNPFFRPGGRTCPLNGPPKEGLPEVVHQPLTAEALALRIEAAIP